MLNSLTLLRAMNGIYEEDVVMAGNSYFDEKQLKHLKTKRIISFALARHCGVCGLFLYDA